MIWQTYSKLEGQHAFLGASNYHWIRYDPEQLKNSYLNYQAKTNGTILHAFAATCIKLNQKLPRSNKTLNMYVNDAIGFKMTPEQVLYYSDNCFGTTDAICFRNNELRIHDLKTGVTPAHMEQLEVYAALFCLNYNVDPKTISITLRLYQNNEIEELIDPIDDVIEIMAKIKSFDKIIDSLKLKE